MPKEVTYKLAAWGLLGAITAGCSADTSTDPGRLRSLLTPAKLAISPDVTLPALKATHLLTVVALAADGDSLPHGGFEWISLEPSVVNVGRSGLVTAEANGLARIVARLGNLADTATVRVEQEPVTFAFNPTILQFDALGDSSRITYTALDANGHIVEADERWRSSAPDIVAVDQSGMATARTPGTATISLQLGSATGKIDVEIRQSVSQFTISPAELKLSGIGSIGSFVISAVDPNGHAVAAPVSWRSEAPEIAAVDVLGRVVAVSEGTAKVTASIADRQAEGHVTVSAAPSAGTLTAVLVSPESVYIEVGDTITLTAVGKAKSGIEAPGVVFAWASSNPSVAAVSQAGMIRALSAGPAVIMASAEGVTGVARVDVHKPSPRDITLRISPRNPTLNSLGESLALSVTAMDKNGTALKCPVAWTSSASEVVSVDSKGSLLSRSAGTALVVAACGGVGDTVTATVQQEVASVSVSPVSLSLQVGEDATLSASALDANGHAIPDPTFTWSSSNLGVATVSSVGLVKAIAAGLASVSVSAAGKSVGASVIVSGSSITPGVYEVPASIAADCSVTVTDELQSWVDEVPDSSTLVFDNNGCYRITGGLELISRAGLNIDGRGATFRTDHVDAHGIVHWRFRGATDLVIRNMTLIGANATAGVQGPYVSTWEGHHGLSFMNGSARILVEDVTVRNVYGDCVYAGSGGEGQQVRDLTVRRLDCRGTGRHGLGLTSVERFTLEDSSIDEIRWSGIDLEVQGLDWYGAHVMIRNNRFGKVRHSLLITGGKGEHTVHDVTFTQNEQLEPGHTCIEPIRLRSPQGYYRDGFAVTDNIFRPLCRPMEVIGVRNFVISCNWVEHEKPESAVYIKDAHDGRIFDNNRGPSRVMFLVDELSTAIELDATRSDCGGLGGGAAGVPTPRAQRPADAR